GGVGRVQVAGDLAGVGQRRELPGGVDAGFGGGVGGGQVGQPLEGGIGVLGGLGDAGGVLEDRTGLVGVTGLDGHVPVEGHVLQGAELPVAVVPHGELAGLEQVGVVVGGVRALGHIGHGR